MECVVFHVVRYFLYSNHRHWVTTRCPTTLSTFNGYSISSPLPLPSLADKGTIDLSIIIPAYNEVSRLPAMLETTISFLRSWNVTVGKVKEWGKGKAKEKAKVT